MNTLQICGIYKITSLSGKIYIGQSQDIYGRFVKYKKHDCQNQRYLYNSIKKHGWDAHKKEIIHVLSDYNLEELNALEKYYGELYNCNDQKSGLNIRECGGNKGKHSEESKKKIGEASSGNKYAVGYYHTEEFKNKMSERLIGHPFWGNKKHADKTKQKIRIGNLNKIISQETKEKIRKKAFGRTHTSETKEKLREANFGKIHTSNTKEKMSKSHLGKKHTPQAIENMIKAQNNPITLQKNKESNLGRIVSPKTKEKLSNIIFNVETGIFYSGIQSASDSINMKYPLLLNRLLGNTKNNTSFIYV